MTTVPRFGLLCALFAGVAIADELPTMQVTATKVAEAIDIVPASVTVVSGDELRARGATDLRSALLLVGGVEGTPTGDGGPAGSVPSIWGLREADAFLLVIDGVPAGGAFNPATLAIDLTGVERIEVLRGAAPVMYGATSFSGVIHILHYAAGKAPSTLGAGIGTEGSYGASYYGTLGGDGWKQSVTANVEKRGYSVDRMESQRFHGLYRAASGGFHLDLEANVIPQKPGSTTFRNGASLRTDLVPSDANHNPSDAKMDENRYGLTAGYDFGAWSSVLSVTKTKDEIVRGFHEAAANNLAHGYEQERDITDVYFDTHAISALGTSLRLTYGLDVLFGRGEQEFTRFPYQVDLDGSNAWSSEQAMENCQAAVPSPAPNGEECLAEESEVERTFAGLYLQSEWTPVESVSVLAGLRLNQTSEKQEGEDPLGSGDIQVKQDKTRLSGVLGGRWTAWRAGNDSFGLFADYRNTFKPIAAELAPEAEVNLLNPETSDSYEFGVRGALADGRLSYDASVFRLDFRNLKTLDDLGNTVNAGATRFQGGELEVDYALFDATRLSANYGYHDARFVSFNRDGTPTGHVDGNRFELSPYHIASLGLIHSGARGLVASAVASYTGERKLNKSNSLRQGGFTTYDASLGWNFGRYSVVASGQNLTDRRDVVAESELSEELAGASSYYLLPGRRILLNFSMAL